MKTIPLLTLSLSLFSAAATHPGKDVYNQFCAACHGANGEGVGNGAFPPLAGSQWVKGDGRLMAQILYNGLTGPIEVSGKVYDLVMPSQGALNDQQKVDVINFVKSTWGRKNSAPFTLEQLKKESQIAAKHNKPWTAPELENLYPTSGPLKNLTMKDYQGKWEMMPDFTQLKALSQEEEHLGKISFRNIDHKTEFGIVWEGELLIAEPGTYEFELCSSDGSIVYLNDQHVVGINEVTKYDFFSRKLGKSKLGKGHQKIRVEYFNNTGERKITLRYKNAKDDKTKWKDLTDMKRSLAVKAPLIDLSPSPGMARVYNNFINGSSPRALAIALPSQQNVVFSSQFCSLDSAWSGKFLSGGQHWSGRGKGYVKPLASKASVLNAKSKAVWLNAKGAPLAVQFKGFTQDATGNPTLKYTVNSIPVTEKYTSSEQGFERTISINGALDASLVLSPTSQSLQNIAQDLSLVLPPKLNSAPHGKGLKTLFSTSSNSSFTLTYQWKK